MNEREAFRKALAENEDDTGIRLVYADWLDEHGEHEEADRQRQWPAAKAWLVRFCRDHNPENDLYTRVFSYQDLLELGLDAVAEAGEEDFMFSCGDNESMCDALRSNFGEFLLNWSIVTGIPVPPGVEDRTSFTCGC